MATVHHTRKEAKHHLGDLPERTFARLIPKGIPRKGDGEKATFPWPDYFHWWTKQREEAARKQATPAAPALQDADRRERVARADLAQMKADEARDMVVSKTAYRAELVVAARALRAAILSMAGRNADQVLGLDTRPRAIKALQLVARDLLETLQSCMDDAPALPDRPRGKEGAA